MNATRCQFGTRAAISGAGQRRRRLRRREVEDALELGQTGGPKGHDWASWDAGLKGFFGQKWEKKENGLQNKISNLFKD
jgi:hypothetical protein